MAAAASAVASRRAANDPPSTSRARAGQQRSAARCRPDFWPDFWPGTALRRLRRPPGQAPSYCPGAAPDQSVGVGTESYGEGQPSRRRRRRRARRAGRAGPRCAASGRCRCYNRRMSWWCSCWCSCWCPCWCPCWCCSCWCAAGAGR